MAEGVASPLRTRTGRQLWAAQPAVNQLGWATAATMARLEVWPTRQHAGAASKLVSTGSA
jgi:hypothetical protein